MKLLKDKILGQVIIITEGEKDEIELFEKIFIDIFNCEVVELTHRDGQEGNFTCKICKSKNENSKILLLNARHSNIKYADDIDFLNMAYAELIENYSYDIDIENSKIFFVFDRDYKSNKNSTIILNLIEKYKDPYDTNDTPGLLILSYPSIESYILSTKITQTSNLKFELGKDVKDYNKKNVRIKICDIDDNCILHAYDEFCYYLKNISAINEWNNIIQNVVYTYQGINKTIYDNQEEFFNIVKFGKYEQDGDESNGAEDIEWIVLDSNNDGELFLISRYILDIQPFNKELCAITWENSSIRKWLNDNFYNVAFTDEEKEKIKLSCVRNDTRVINDLNNISTINDLNENYEKDTFDKLYLLSNKEISQYHDYICKKIPYGTEYAKNVARNSRFQNAYWLSPDEFYEPDYDDDGNPILDDMLNERTYFWLRTPGFYQHMVLTCGYTDDDIYDSESVACDFESGVRPAMWVKYK